MGETGCFFEVADGELAGGVAAVVPVGFDRRGLGVLLRFDAGFSDGQFGVLSGVGLVVPVG